jgi:vacuolar protein sorting-associated protein 45
MPDASSSEIKGQMTESLLPTQFPNTQTNKHTTHAFETLTMSSSSAQRTTSRESSASSRMINYNSLNGIAAMEGYLERIITGDSKCHGMKVLLLDGFTTQIVSAVYSQSQVLEKQVYLVSRLEDAATAIPSEGPAVNASNSSSRHLKAVCFLRPTQANAGLLLKELASPRFCEYHIFFSGIVTSGILRLLAEHDENEVIKQVQEFYGDYVPVNNDLITLNCRNTIAMTASAGTTWARKHAHLYERNRQGIESMLLSLKRRPTSIRYQASSALAQQMARDVQEQLTQDIFHFRTHNCLLLIVDRADDPVTPLLSQWTYQAMVHELLGLNNHRVMLKGAPNVPPDLQEVVLDQHDDFFRQNQTSNFGELGEAIQTLLHDYQAQTASHSTANLNTIEDMQAFMDKFPELKSQSHTVSKHVALMGELARLVDVCSLMDVSQLEQELACADNHSLHFREVMTKIQSIAIKIPDKLRLGLLYALKYETSGDIHSVKAEMKRGGVPDELMDLMDTILQYGGRGVRGPGLYGIEKRDIMSNMKSILTSVQGVSNVYAQHVPVLMDTLHAIARGKLSRQSHPFCMNQADHQSSTTSTTGEEAVPSEVIVFMAGGVTYEEAAKVSEFNANHRGKIRVILGGSTIHNSTSFLEELRGLP